MYLSQIRHRVLPPLPIQLILELTDSLSVTILTLLNLVQISFRMPLVHKTSGQLQRFVSLLFMFNLMGQYLYFIPKHLEFLLHQAFLYYSIYLSIKVLLPLHLFLRLYLWGHLGQHQHALFKILYVVYDGVLYLL